MACPGHANLATPKHPRYGAGEPTTPAPRPTGMRNPRLLIPLLAALAVLVVVGSLLALRGGPGDEAGAPGGAAPGSPAPAEPVPVSPGPSGLPPTRDVTLQGWTGHGTTIRVSYTSGLPACSGQVLPPQVEETASSVTVTLLLQPPRHRRLQMCPDLAMVKAVEVHLRAPVGGRVVRDGGHGGAPVPEGAPAGLGMPMR